jgi:hypothetical protein
MKLAEVQAPVVLLREPRLTPAAKLLWLVARLLAGQGPVTYTRLGIHTGLSPKTLRQGIDQLAAAGWYRMAPAGGGRPAAVDLDPSGERVTIPGELLTDRQVGIRGRALYGLLQITHGFCRPRGEFTYPGLSDLAGASINTVKRVVQEWVEAGWLKVEQKSRYSPVQFELRHSVLARRKAELAWARERLKKGKFGGETLMREYLSLLVDKPYEDNAAPRFLLNPFTKAPMQFDRYYPPGVALEYNGPQHYGTTEYYDDPQQAVEQRARDLMKIGICQTEGIRLVVVHAEDLSLQGMQAKVDGLLPLRSLAGQEALIALLEARSRRYREEAERGRPIALR